MAQYHITSVDYHYDGEDEDDDESDDDCHDDDIDLHNNSSISYHPCMTVMKIMMEITLLIMIITTTMSRLRLSSLFLMYLRWPHPTFDNFLEILKF